MSILVVDARTKDIGRARYYLAQLTIEREPGHARVREMNQYRCAADVTAAVFARRGPWAARPVVAGDWLKTSPARADGRSVEP